MRRAVRVDGRRWRLQLVMLFVSAQAARAPAAGAETANILGHEESSDREHRGNRELHSARTRQ